MKKKRAKKLPHAEATFTVTLPNGYSGQAHVTPDGWLSISSVDGTKRAAIQTTPVESLAQILLGEIALRSGRA